jgi:hypothetical protein
VEIEGLNVLFLNTPVLRMDVSGNSGFKKPRRVRDVALGSVHTSRCSDREIVGRSQSERKLNRTSSFRVMLIMQHARTLPQGRPGLTVSNPFEDHATVMCDLTLSVKSNTQRDSGRECRQRRVVHWSMIWRGPM